MVDGGRRVGWWWTVEEICQFLKAARVRNFHAVHGFKLEKLAIDLDMNLAAATSLAIDKDACNYPGSKVGRFESFIKLCP